MLHPECKTTFSYLKDALQGLLPYHMYQGALSSPSYYKVDEEFETVSTQLLKRTQALAPAHQACDLALRDWWIAFHDLG